MRDLFGLILKEATHFENEILLKSYLKIYNRLNIFSLLEKYNMTTTELSKYKDRDALQTNELTELRQSSALLQRVCI